MKKFILILLLIIINSPNIFSQTWDEQLVNAGSLLGSKSIFLDQGSNPIILYYRGRNLFFSKWNGSSWTTKILHTLPSSYYHFASLNGAKWDDNIHIIYYDRISDRYEYYHMIIDTQGNVLSNLMLLIADDTNPYGDYQLTIKNGTIYRAFIESSQLYLQIYDSSWSNHILVDGSANIGGKLDITLDNNNMVWISYYDATLKNLKVAKSKDTNYDSWDVWVVDSEGAVGSESKIWVDNSNIAHIAYYDATNQKLKYATFNP